MTTCNWSYWLIISLFDERPSSWTKTHLCASKGLSEWTESCLLRQGFYEVIYITYITLGVKSMFIHNNFFYSQIRTIQEEIQEEFQCSSRHWSGISGKKYRYNLAIQFYHLDSRVLLPRHPDPSFELFLILTQIQCCTFFWRLRLPAACFRLTVHEPCYFDTEAQKTHARSVALPELKSFTIFYF